MQSLSKVNPSILQECFEQLNLVENSIEILNDNISRQFKNIEYTISEQNECLDRFRKVIKNETLRLNDEAISEIFLFLNLNEVSQVISSCKKWNAVVDNPFFLRRWIKRNNSNIFNICENFSGEILNYYAKNFLRMEKINKNIKKIKNNDDTITKIFSISIFISIPIFLLYINGVQEANKKGFITTYLENNPGVSPDEAENEYWKDLMDSYT